MSDCTYERIEAGRIRCTTCGKERDWPQAEDLPRRNCKLAKPAAPREYGYACIHRGERIGTQGCRQCGRKGESVTVFQCALHGRCAESAFDGPTGMRNEGIAYCGTCDDFTKLDDLLAADAEPASLLLRFRRPGGGAVNGGDGGQHGLGDAVQLRAVLRHLRKYRPHLRLTVACHENRWPLLEALADCVDEDHPAEAFDYELPMPWPEADRCNADSPSTKVERCLRETFGIEPDPELVGHTVPITAEARARAERYAAELVGRYAATAARPCQFALLHNDGITGGRRASRDIKNVTDVDLGRLVLRLQERGIIPVLLGWHGLRGCLPHLCGVERPGAGHWLWDGQDHADPCVLAALAERAAICVGVDSGPGHVMAASGTPTVISWIGHHPLNYMPPMPNVLHLVPSGPPRLRPGCRFEVASDYWTARYNSVEYHDTATADRPCDDLGQALPAAVDSLLDRHVYGLPRAADATLQNCILRRCRPDPKNDGHPGQPHDRPKSLDLVFRLLAERFQEPVIVETGCVRAVNDWSGAGNFGILAAWWISHRGGELHSVDLFADKCAFARERLRLFGLRCHVHQSDSIAWLAADGRRIDLLYLDSLDTYPDPDAAAVHALAELQAAQHRLHERSIVCIDDTPMWQGQRYGKGKLALPWLEQNGWRILHAGYQIVATRAP